MDPGWFFEMFFEENSKNMTLPHIHLRFWRKKFIMRIKITSSLNVPKLRVLKAQVINVTIPISLEHLNYLEGFGPKWPLCYVLKHLWQVYNDYSLQFSSDLGIQQGTPKFQQRSIKTRVTLIKTKKEHFTWITTRQAKGSAIVFTFLGILICESLLY